MSWFLFSCIFISIFYFMFSILWIRIIYLDFYFHIGCSKKMICLNFYSDIGCSKKSKWRICLHFYSDIGCPKKNYLSWFLFSCRLLQKQPHHTISLTEPIFWCNYLFNLYYLKVVVNVYIIENVEILGLIVEWIFLIKYSKEENRNKESAFKNFQSKARSIFFRDAQNCVHPWKIKKK